MRISDWSSDVCSSDLPPCQLPSVRRRSNSLVTNCWVKSCSGLAASPRPPKLSAIRWPLLRSASDRSMGWSRQVVDLHRCQYQHRTMRILKGAALIARSEEHTSELQSLMRISYAVFCLK